MTMKTNYVWIRKNNKTPFEFERYDHIKNEKLQNYNDWFLAVKQTDDFYLSFYGNSYWIKNIDISPEAVTRPYTDLELEELYEQEDELKRIFSIL